MGLPVSQAPGDARHTGGWPRLTRNPVVGLLLVAAAGAAAYCYAHFVVGPHHHQFDLRIYFRAVNFWLSGENIYDYQQLDAINGTLGYTYPPLAAVLMSPMGLFSFATVKVITLVSIVLVAIWCVWLCLRERMTIPRERWLLIVGLVTAGVFFLDPLRATLSFGQVNIYLMALVLLDALVLARRGSRWTGVGVGLAMAIKLTPGIFLLYFLLSRQLRAALVAVATAIVATLLAAIVTPTETWQFYTRMIFSGATGHAGGASNQSIKGLLARLATPFEPSSVLWLVLALVVTALACWRIRQAADAGDVLAGLTITGFLGFVVSPVSWSHHLVWVIPATIILVARAVALRRGSDLAGRSWRQWIPVVFLLALGFVTQVMDYRGLLHLPDPSYFGRDLVEKVLASGHLYFAIAVIALLPIERRKQARGQVPIS